MLQVLHVVGVRTAYVPKVMQKPKSLYKPDHDWSTFKFLIVALQLSIIGSNCGRTSTTVKNKSVQLIFISFHSLFIFLSLIYICFSMFFGGRGKGTTDDDY